MSPARKIRPADKVHPDPSAHPYLAARTTRVDASLRRQRLLLVLAFVVVVLTVGHLSLVAWILTTQDDNQITPYLVRVADDGAILGVDPLDEPAEPDRAMVHHALRLFLINSRTVTTDRSAQRALILRAYAYATDRATAVLNDYYRDNPPFDRPPSRASVTPVLTSFLHLSDRDVYQVQWREEVRNRQGTHIQTHHWRALLTVTVRPPDGIQEALVNPLGIRVSDIDWTRTTETDGATP